jgi:hypothetical protein
LPAILEIGVAAQARIAELLANPKPTAPNKVRRIASRREIGVFIILYVLSFSMSELEFRAVDQRPGEIESCLLTAFGGLAVCHGDLQFRVGWVTRQNRQVKLVDLLAQIAGGLQQGAKPGALFQLVPDMTRIQKMQLLGGRW